MKDRHTRHLPNNRQHFPHQSRPPEGSNPNSDFEMKLSQSNTREYAMYLSRYLPLPRQHVADLAEHAALGATRRHSLSI